MKKIKKIAVAALAIATLLTGNAYAFRLHVTNNTLEDVRLTCQGDCAALKDLHEAIVSKASDRFFDVLPNFKAEVTLTSLNSDSSCLYFVKHTPDSCEGALTVDKITCTGSIEGNKHNDATHNDSHANIDLSAK